MVKVQRMGDSGVHTDPFHAQGSLQKKSRKKRRTVRCGRLQGNSIYFGHNIAFEVCQQQ